MKKLKFYFLSRLLREKVLLLALVAIAAAIWVSSFARRAQVAAREQIQVSTDLAVQGQWLERKERIEALAKAAIEHLDPAKSLDAVRLTAEVSDMAADQSSHISGWRQPTRPRPLCYLVTGIGVQAHHHLCQPRPFGRLLGDRHCLQPGWIKDAVDRALEERGLSQAVRRGHGLKPLLLVSGQPHCSDFRPGHEQIV